MASTSWYDGYILDQDGTLLLSDELLPGAKRFVDALRAAGKVVRFLSNNPTLEPEQLRAKLGRLGLDAEPGEVVNAVATTTRWLSERHPDATVFVIGEEPLREAIRAAGLRLSEDPAEIDIVVASYDRGFDYRKLQIAFDAIWFHRRAFLIQTNPDRFCPYAGGRGEPDAAAITAAIEAATSTTCRASLGKPSPLMLEAALSGTGLRPEHCLMVGDRLATDIQMALDAGMDSALVLTGESTRADVAARPAGQRPTYVVERIDDLLPPTEHPCPHPTTI